MKLIDASPIGINVRSTVATYANVHDELRKIYAKTEDAKAGKYKAGDFSYNTGGLRCPICDGTGQISLDVQTLLGVFQALVDRGATVLVIEHDLDVIRNADYIIDMGPGGGEEGGRVVAVGTPEEIARNRDSVTGRFLNLGGEQ